MSTARLRNSLGKVWSISAHDRNNGSSRHIQPDTQTVGERRRAYVSNCKSATLSRTPDARTRPLCIFQNSRARRKHMGRRSSSFVTSLKTEIDGNAVGLMWQRTQHKRTSSQPSHTSPSPLSPTWAPLRRSRPCAWLSMPRSRSPVLSWCRCGFCGGARRDPDAV
jgi:hypothetical protein